MSSRIFIQDSATLALIYNYDATGSKMLSLSKIEAFDSKIDSNLEETQRFIIDNLKNEIEVATKHVGQKDYKTVLQEKLQAHGTTSIKYEIIDEKGPDHAKIFVSQVEWNGKKLAIGEGKSKKIAEMEAARKALELLK